jgi:hypothetical protein
VTDVTLIKYVKGEPIRVHWLVYAVLMGIVGTYFIAKSLRNIFSSPSEQRTSVETYTGSTDAGNGDPRILEPSSHPMFRWTLSNDLAAYHRWYPVKPMLILAYLHFSS